MSEHEDAVTRAALPEVMFVSDVAVALRVGEDTARRIVLRGECGAYLRLGGRIAVLRETFLDTLQQRQVLPGPMPAPRSNRGSRG